MGLSTIEILLASVCAAASADCRSDAEFAIQPGREPAGTCAIEGFFRGDTEGLSRQTPVTVFVSSFDRTTSEERGRSFRVTSYDRRFRVAGVPCATEQDFGISARTDNGRGGGLHSTFGGNVAQLSGRSGDRLVNVRVDLMEGARFRGVVRDAQTGAPVEGVSVNAVYESYGRDGWARPQEWALSDANGEWILYGVQRARLPHNLPPTIHFHKRGYSEAQATTTVPSGDAVSVVNATIEREPAR